MMIRIVNNYIFLFYRNESNVNDSRNIISLFLFSFYSAFGAPALDGDSFMLDMATSTVALGKVEISQRRGLDIPNTWGVNSQG